MIIDNKLAEAIRELSAVLQKPHDRIAELEWELAIEKAAREKAERALTEADLQWTKINLDLSVAVTDARDYATQTKQECDHSVIEERQLRTHTERELAIEKAAHTEDQERLDALECLVLAGYDVTADVESGTLYVFIQTDGSESAPIYRGVGNLRAAIDAALAEWRKERDAPQA